MFQRIYFAGCFLLFLIIMYFAFITFQPIRNVKINDVGLKSGIVNKTYLEGGDLYVRLNNDPHNYYINNAIKALSNPQKIAVTILKKKVTLYYIKKWTPLSTDKVFPHISKLMLNDAVLYSEIKE